MEVGPSDLRSYLGHFWSGCQMAGSEMAVMQKVVNLFGLSGRSNHTTTVM